MTKRRGKRGNTEQRELDALHEHPRQRELFPELPDHELQQLATDMKAHGLQHPIEILPDGTIVAGHQRVRAARSLGWTTIDVIVRHDLAAEGETAVVTYLMADNFFRRQLSPLARARCIRAMLELALGRKAAQFGHGAREKLKKEVGERVNMSERNVSRYLAALDAPVEVQEAFDRGEVKLDDAARVGRMDARAKRGIARRIVAGESAQQIVNEFFRGKPDVNVSRSFRNLAGALEREVARLEPHVAKVHPNLIHRRKELFQAAIALLTDFMEAAEVAP